AGSTPAARSRSNASPPTSGESAAAGRRGLNRPRRHFRLPHLVKPTGLLGGRFNPAHGGHRAITLFAVEALGLDEAWWLVSPGNPLKPKAGIAPLPARSLSPRQMARHAPLSVWTTERALGTVVAIDPLRALQPHFPRRRFVWLMGADTLAQLHLRKDWRSIAAASQIAVLARPRYDDAALPSP